MSIAQFSKIVNDTIYNLIDSALPSMRSLHTISIEIIPAITKIWKIKNIPNRIRFPFTTVLKLIIFLIRTDPHVIQYSIIWHFQHMQEPPLEQILAANSRLPLLLNYPFDFLICWNNEKCILFLLIFDVDLAIFLIYVSFMSAAIFVILQDSERAYIQQNR